MCDKQNSNLTSRETISDRLLGRMGDNWLPHNNNRDLKLDRQAYKVDASKITQPIQTRDTYFPNHGATSQPQIPSVSNTYKSSHSSNMMNEIDLPMNSRPLSQHCQEDLINQRMQSLQPLPHGSSYPLVKNSLYHFQ